MLEAMDEGPWRSVVSGSPEHNAAWEWYYRECDLLDDGDALTWLEEMVDATAHYRIPVYQTLGRQASTGQGFHVDENFDGLRLRLERAQSASAWTESPPPVLARMVGNLRMWNNDRGRVRCTTRVVVHRSRDGQPTRMVVTRREDILSTETTRWRLIGRVVHLNRAVISPMDLESVL